MHSCRIKEEEETPELCFLFIRSVKKTVEDLSMSRNLTHVQSIFAFRCSSSRVISLREEKILDRVIGKMRGGGGATRDMIKSILKQLERLFDTRTRTISEHWSLPSTTITFVFLFFSIYQQIEIRTKSKRHNKVLSPRLFVWFVNFQEEMSRHQKPSSSYLSGM